MQCFHGSPSSGFEFDSFEFGDFLFSQFGGLFFFFIEVFCFSNWDLKFFAFVGPAWIFISFLM